jgi:hypothetical protein
MLLAGNLIQIHTFNLESSTTTGRLLEVAMSPVGIGIYLNEARCLSTGTGAACWRHKDDDLFAYLTSVREEEREGRPPLQEFWVQVLCIAHASTTHLYNQRQEPATTILPLARRPPVCLFFKSDNPVGN